MRWAGFWFFFFFLGRLYANYVRKGSLRSITSSTEAGIGPRLIFPLLHDCVCNSLAEAFKRTFPHIPISGSKLSRVEEEAGSVLLVALLCSGHWAALVRTKNLIDCWTVLIC